MALFRSQPHHFSLPKLSWSGRWFFVLVLVPLTLLSACGEQGHQATVNAFYGVAAVSPTDIWAVGNMSSPTASTLQGLGLIEHWDGQQWQMVHSSINGTLSGIAAIAANDVWAVGTSGSLLTIQWDGTRWSQVVVPGASGGVDTGLSAIAAVSSHDVWAVGHQEGLPIALHWDGQSWQTAPLAPSSFMRDGALDAVQAISTHDIWVVGWYSKLNSSARYTLAEHWNGKNWQFIPTPEYTAKYPPNQSLSDANFSSLVALSSKNIWAVGNADPYDGTGTPSRTLVEHWDGTQWEIMHTPSEAKTDDSYPRSIFAVNAHDIWIAGYRYSTRISTNYPLLLHWDGQSWQFATPPALKNTGGVFSAGTAIATNNLWVAGSSGGAFPPAPTMGTQVSQTWVEQWDGTRWSYVRSPSPGQPIYIPGG
jgi:hypothetical protein